MLSVLSAMGSSSSGQVGVAGGAVVGERLAGARDEPLDRVRKVLLADVVVTGLDPELVGLEQHLGVGKGRRRLEAVGGELDQEAERILEVDRVHEAAVLDAAMADAPLVEPLDSLREG